MAAGCNLDTRATVAYRLPTPYCRYNRSEVVCRACFIWILRLDFTTPDGLSIPPLPEYINPPVIETVLGLQFDRLASFSNAHLGAFWKTLDQNEWTKVEDAPPIPNQVERFSDAVRWVSGLHVQLTDDTACRAKIRNQTGNRMIQVQNSRLHLNWLGEYGDTYPRYEKVRAEFERTYQSFSQFTSQELDAQVKPNQWEVTYVNHIPQGTVWKSSNDWNFFKLLGTTSPNASIAVTEGFHGEWHFVIPEKQGRLHIDWQHGKKSPMNKDGKEFIRLAFTARGPIAKNDDTTIALLDGLDLGRQVIVSMFRDCMTDTANDFWGLEK